MNREFWKQYISMILGALLALCIPLAVASSYGDINVTSCIPGTGATNLGKAEDSASADTHTGVYHLGIRKDVPDTTTTGTDGDYSQISTDKRGILLNVAEPTGKATYMATAVPVARAASATDMFYLKGSSSKTVRVLKIFLNYLNTTTNAANNFYLIKRSTANSGGTSTTETIIPLDSGSAAATAVALDYTANPTPGSSVGNVKIHTIYGGAITNAAIVNSDIPVFDADKFGSALVLRGTGEGIAVNNNGATVAGGTPLVGWTVVWTEE